MWYSRAAHRARRRRDHWERSDQRPAAVFRPILSQVPSAAHEETMPSAGSDAGADHNFESQQPHQDSLEESCAVEGLLHVQVGQW